MALSVLGQVLGAMFAARAEVLEGAGLARFEALFAAPGSLRAEVADRTLPDALVVAGHEAGL